MMPVATAAVPMSPTPQVSPMAAMTHSDAAVVRFRTTVPCRKMIPAPRKPMPTTTCDATRVTSTWKLVLARTRLELVEAERRHDAEQAGTEADGDVRAQPGRLLGRLALGADDGAEDDGDERGGARLRRRTACSPPTGASVVVVRPDRSVVDCARVDGRSRRRRAVLLDELHAVDPGDARRRRDELGERLDCSSPWMAEHTRARRTELDRRRSRCSSTSR